MCSTKKLHAFHPTHASAKDNPVDCSHVSERRSIATLRLRSAFAPPTRGQPLGGSSPSVGQNLVEGFAPHHELALIVELDLR